MATITATGKLTLVDGALVDTVDLALAEVTQAGTGGPTPGRVLVPTATELDVTLDLTSPGWLVMMNTDPTNRIKWGFTTGNLKARMSKAGGFVLLELDPGTLHIYLQAVSADAWAIIKAYEA